MEHIEYKELREEDLDEMISCFCGTVPKEKLDMLVSSRKVSHPKNYFKYDWFGFGLWRSWSEYQMPATLVSYCMVKNPRTFPETLTVTKEKSHGLGYATDVRNYTLRQIEKKEKAIKSNVIYSFCELDNPASIKSVMKSGYILFDVQDNHLCFMKPLKIFTFSIKP